MLSEFTPLHRPPVGGEYYVFRDVVHNLIEIEDEDNGRYVRELLRTPEMQRLRRVRQNGLGSLVYSSLEGSRFPHALGSFHIARRVITSLHERQPTEGQGFPTCLQMRRQDCFAFAIAALLHDIGHGPLSHVWEECFEGYDHEHVGVQIVENTDERIGLVGSILANPNAHREFANLGNDVLEFLQGRHQLSYLLPLLGGNLDVDRLDFVSRDTKTAGVTYGFHELDWIIRSFRFARLPSRYLEGEPPRWVIAIDGRKGLSTLVQFLHARENMYRLVYHHKTTRVATCMLRLLFKRASELARKPAFSCASFSLLSAMRVPPSRETLPLGTLMQLDDSEVWTSLKAWAQDGAADTILRDLSQKLLKRDLFKAFVLSKDVYRRLLAIDSRNGGKTVRKIVAARLGFRDERSAEYYYSFDSTSFDVIGKRQSELWRDVWIMQSGALGFEFQTLRAYWHSNIRSADSSNQYLLIVHRDVVEDLSSLIERLSFPAESARKMTRTSKPPKPYILVAPLGREGAWKEVWVGTNSSAGSVPEKLVALKRYKTIDGKKGAIQRDVKAINLLAEPHMNLSTPRLLRPSKGTTWISEPLWTGSLEDLIRKQGGRKDILEIIDIARQLFSGLAHLHDCKLRHTDIKPDNCGIMGSRIGDRRYVLGDFGCTSSHPELMPTDHRLLGTLRTRAPEIIQLKSISQKSDVWSMAATIYALCLVDYPFVEFNAPHNDQQDRNARETRIRAGLSELERSFLEKVNSDFPPVLATPLAKCFAPEHQRLSSRECCESFGAIYLELKGSGDELIRTAWQRAEDIASRLGSIGSGVSLLGAEVEEIQALCTTYERFVPRRLRETLNKYLNSNPSYDH